MPESELAVGGMTSSSSKGRLRGLSGSLRKRDFRLFWVGESTSQMGTAISEVVLPLVGVKVLHAGTFAIACLTAATWLPWLLLGLPAGAWVDRFRKRTLMVVCDLIALVLFASIALSAWSHLLTVAQLLVIALLAGIVSVFFKAAFQAYIPTLLDRDDLLDGNGKLQASGAFATVGGPGIGGAIAQFLGIATGVMLNAASFAVSAICLLGIKTVEPESRNPHTRRKLGQEIGEGLGFLLHDPYLRPLAAYTSVISLGVSGTDALMVVFLVRTVGATSSETGIILGLMGVGGLFGAFIATSLVRVCGSARAMLVCRILLTFALLIPLTTRGFGLLFAGGWVLVTAGIVSGNTISLSFRQARCPSSMRGRISASYYTITYSGMALGAAFGGILGSILGVRDALWITCGILASASVILFFSPIRHLRELPEPATLDTDSLR